MRPCLNTFEANHDALDAGPEVYEILRELTSGPDFIELATESLGIEDLYKLDLPIARRCASKGHCFQLGKIVHIDHKHYQIVSYRHNMIMRRSMLKSWLHISPCERCTDYTGGDGTLEGGKHNAVA